MFVVVVVVVVVVVGGGGGGGGGGVGVGVGALIPGPTQGPGVRVAGRAEKAGNIQAPRKTIGRSITVADL